MPRRALCLIVAALLLATGAACRAQAPKTFDVRGDRVTIVRDAYGVPHVFAKTLHALFVGDGYAVAEDRLGQMELYRRTGRGEMAALVGPSAVAADRETRIDGYTEEERRQQFERLPAEVQAILTAYAEGINRYIGELQASSEPVDLKPANFPGTLDVKKLRPWLVTDTLAVGQMMARRFGGSEGGELRNLLVLSMLKLRYKQDAYGYFNDALWRNDISSPTTLPPADDPRAARFVPTPHWATPTGAAVPRPKDAWPQALQAGDSSPDALPQALQAGDSSPDAWPQALQAGDSSPDALPQALQARDSSPEARSSAAPAALDPAIAILDQRARMELANRLGLPTKWGSYCMAVSRARSATGNALLVGGPQMGFRTPQIAHEIHLCGAGIDVIGMGFAGVPGTLIGATRSLTWSTTSGVNDQTDIFVEELDPADATRYRYRGEWRKMEERTEDIEVAGGDKQAITIRRTVHGPVVQVDAGKHVAYARCSSYWQRENETFAAFLMLTRAKTAREFGAACALIPISTNMFCATRDGDIGYWYCGRTPVRAPGVDPRLPTPGDGSKDWRGILPFEQMPHVINPKQGFLCNWNNKPAVWWDNQDTSVWGRVFHNERIARLLAAKPKLAPEDLRRILLDIGANEIDADVLLPLLLDAVKRGGASLSPGARRAASRLAAWDRHASEGSVATTIFYEWTHQVRESLFAKQFGFIKLQGQRMFDLAMQPSFIYHVLMAKGSPVPVQADYLTGRTPDAVMLDALNKAVAALEKKSGPEMAAWTYSRGRIGFSPLPSIPATDRGTYIQIVEVTPTGPCGANICPPGQSERTDSPHCGDQRDLAAWFQFKPMLIDTKP